MRFCRKKNLLSQTSNHLTFKETNMTKHISNHFTIETEQEDDGRWIAEILEISGALVYGNSQQQAIAHVQALALRVIADKLEHGEMALGLTSFDFVAA